MIAKLVVLLALGFFLFKAAGKYLRPPASRRDPGPVIETARKCPGCGAYVIGDGACDTFGCEGRRG